MSQPILVTGAAGGAQGSTGRRIAALLLDKVFRFVPSSIRWMQGLMLSGNSVRKLCRGICWTETPSALLSKG
jgi:hypothetical protein